MYEQEDHEVSEASLTNVQIELGDHGMFNKRMSDVNNSQVGLTSSQLLRKNPDSDHISNEDGQEDEKKQEQKVGTLNVGVSSRSQKQKSIANKSQKQDEKNKSYHGFDLGQAKAHGAHFSNIRQKTEGQEANFYDSETQRGKEFVENLMKQQENRFQKKFAFERGQYNQCIVNPRNENQMITVQIVKRLLEGHNATDQNDNHDVFADGQETSVSNENLSLQFQRYNLAPPSVTDNNKGGSGEGEGEGDENYDANSQSKFSRATGHSFRSGANHSSRLGVSQYGGLDDELYKDNVLTAVVDPIVGIAPTHYADIIKSESQNLISRAYMDCKEFAVIAYWDFKAELNQFKCSRFFIVPDPKKRTIREIDGTTQDQVLYSSTHNNEIFFFYEGYELVGIEDLDEEMLQKREKKLQITFLKLEMKEEELADVGEGRFILYHCHNFRSIGDGILALFINSLDLQKYDEQKQLPNPTVIDTVTAGVSTFTGISAGQKSKTLVFTAYLQQQNYSREQQSQDDAVDEHWYPTIFFYDLDKNKVVWEIFGAEQFISIDRKKKVTFLTNEIWSELTENKLEELKDEDFSRHGDYDNYIYKINYDSSAPIDQLNDRYNKAPVAPTLVGYRLTFGENKKLDITEDVKVVEAYLHSNNKRVTLIYKGHSAFTFVLRDAKNLVVQSGWKANYQGRDFNVKLAFSKDRKSVSGSGKDEENIDVEVNIDLHTNQTIPYWVGNYETDEEAVQIMITDLNFDMRTQTFEGKIDNEHGDIISGSFDGQKNNSYRNFKFTIENGNENDHKTFVGTIDNNFSRMKGKWSSGQYSMQHDFDIYLEDPVPGTMRIKFGEADEITESITVDFKGKEIKNQKGSEPNIEEFYALEAVDQAEICSFILQSDVNFVLETKNAQNKQNAFVQAKLVAFDEEDESSNGLGIASSQVILYSVSENLSYQRDKKNAGKKFIVKEPKEKKYVKFYLNQSYLRTQEKKEGQLWTVNPSFITSDNRFIGSVIYEEYGTDELVLNFVTAKMDQIQDQEVFEYPQQPMPQSWIVDYPLLAYKTYTPMNKEIAIVHMALNMPQRVIHLGEWEFVCFVNHTQMVEQKLFKKSKETNCDIMFLVRREEQIRLMSFKSNPWLHFNYESNVNDGVKEDEDICKEAIFIFSGRMNNMPTQDIEGNDIDPTEENKKKYSKRFNNDKIQSAQLIQKTHEGKDYYTLIMQYNDCIVQISLNKELFKVISEPQAMIRRHIVRGYNEQIFYAETQGNNDKIWKIEFHKTKNNEITKKEIFQLAGGSWLVAFEADGECIQNDLEEEVNQSLFIMDDQQKIYCLKNDDAGRFITTKVIDFSFHQKLQDVNALRDNDWTHVHVTERSLSFGEKTYSLKSMLSAQFQVPENYFGQVSIPNNKQNDQSQIEDDQADEDSDSDDMENKEEQEEDWVVQSVQAMSMTTNYIAQCQRNHKEFCFVVKPAPASRQLNIVGFQQLHEIEQMLFVSNNHVLMKFRGGKTVTLLSNGCILHQSSRVQRYMEQNSKIIGESQIFKAKKIILFRQKYGDDLEKQQYIAVQFNNDGIASIIGIYDEFRKQVERALDQYHKLQLQILPSIQQEEPVEEPDKMNLAIGQSLNKMLDPALQATKSQVGKTLKVKQKVEIGYAKEFFVTQKGEVIKMAAIVTKDPLIRAQLKVTYPRFSEDQPSVLKTIKRKKKVVQFQTGDVVETFISVFGVQNTHKLEEEQDNITSVFKVIVFHCLNEAHKKEIESQTQFSVVGNYLCHRGRNQQIIWATKLKDDQNGFIAVNNSWTETQSERRSQVNQSSMSSSNLYDTFKSKCINISQMVNQNTLIHIQMTEVPKAYFTTIKERNGKRLTFYSNLIQVTVESHGMIFDLDSDPIKEIDTIENIDMLINPDEMVNTGFIMSTSCIEKEEEREQIKRTQIFTNEYFNLLFEKQQIRQIDNKGKHKFKISGMLFRTFCEMDLFQLKDISDTLDKRNKLAKIDSNTILTIFEGHTIFSIFWDRIQVFEQILSQLQEEEFEDEDDSNGQDTENSRIRRLYRVLNLPTMDLTHYKKKAKKVTDEEQKRLDNHIQEEDAWYQKVGAWFRGKLGIVLDSEERGDIGFRSIMKKSLHFELARFRESLMQIAMLCQENSISNFVENQHDIRILFTSMSPATVEFFDQGFNETRFTKKVRNLDWKLGTTLKVIGQNDSVLTTKEANKLVSGGTRAQDSEKVQNRQVDTKLLNIDWVFASYAGNKTIGFRELVSALSDAPHESLFATEFVVTLIAHFWARYQRALIYKCFFPFLVYFVTTQWYLTTYALNGVPEDEKTSFSGEFIQRIIVLILSLYFLFFEIVTMLRDGWSYFKDVTNFVDLSLSFLVLVNIYLTTYVYKGEGVYENYRPLPAVTSLLLWNKAFYWMRLFSQTAFYVKLIFETIIDIRYFLILFIAILMTFGNALMIMNAGRGEESHLYANIFSIEFVNTVMNQYMLSLGEFDTENFKDKSDDIIIWLLFIATTFITQITFLNMLIAIMGDTFARVSEVKEQSALQERIKILSDYVIVVPRESVKEGNLSRFIFAISPKALGTDEGSSWEGTVTQLKKTMDAATTTIKGNIGKHMVNVQGEMANMTQKMASLDDKINDLQNSQQRLPNVGEIEQIFRKILQEQRVNPVNASPQVIEENHDYDQDDVIGEGRSSIRQMNMNRQNHGPSQYLNIGQ